MKHVCRVSIVALKAWVVIFWTNEFFNMILHSGLMRNMDNLILAFFPLFFYWNAEEKRITIYHQ